MPPCELAYRQISDAISPSSMSPSYRRTWQYYWPQSLLKLALVLLVQAAIVAQTQAEDAPVLKKLSIEELMGIEVTSVSKRPEKLAETASAIQVITAEDIRRSGATSLPEALRLASNLEVAQIDSRQWAITARGFNNTTANKLLVLIDGRTVYTPLYAGVFWDAQDTLLEDIDRIEVISGPGATLWGANAVNGVINITTQHAQATQGILVTGGGGDELKKFGGLRYGGTLGGDFNYRVYGKHFERDDVVLPNGADVASAWHMTQGGFRADGTLSGNDALTVQGDWYQGKIDQVTLADVEISGGNVLGRWSRVLADQSTLNLQVYFDRTHRRIPGSITEDLDTYDLDFQHRLLLANRHDVVWGLNYRYIDDTIVNPAALAFLPPHVTRQWYSAFAQDEIALIENQLHLTIGTKLEHNEYTGFEYQPSARLAWQLDARNLLWSAVSRAIRTPSRIDGELYAPGNPPFTVLVGNPAFESEKLLAYELGYRAQAYQRLSTSVSTFYNDYDDLRSVERLNPPATSPVFLGNTLTARSYGAELTADYAVTDTWRLRAGYTQFKIDFQHKPGSTDANTGSSEAQDAEQFWSLRSSLDLPRNVQLDATYRHVSRIASQNLPAYGELDLRLGWQLPNNLELAVVGQNLLHAHHAEFGTISPSLNSTRKDIERSVYGGLSWHY